MSRLFANPGLRRWPLALAVLLPLSGCAGGGASNVEFEGGIFRMMGLGNSGNATEKKVPDRAPLVLPPKKTDLPAPGERESVASRQDWPRDPDAVRKANKAEEEKREQAYRDKGDWSKDAGIDEFEKLMDPMKRRPGILGDGQLGDRFRKSEADDTAQ